MGDQDIEHHDDGTHVIPINAGEMLDTIFNRFISSYTPFGFHASQEDVVYKPLPYKPDEGDQLLNKYPWRVILELVTEDTRLMMGIDLFGDIILGRGESQPGRIIIDLDQYGAQGLGVSRIHAMLRPTMTQLFVIDQGSTNGTTINGVRSGRGIATPLKHEDLLRLGNMMFVVHVIHTAEAARAQAAV